MNRRAIGLAFAIPVVVAGVPVLAHAKINQPKVHIHINLPHLPPAKEIWKTACVGGATAIGGAVGGAVSSGTGAVIGAGVGAETGHENCR